MEGSQTRTSESHPVSSKGVWHEEDSGYLDYIKALAEITCGVDLFLVVRSPASRSQRITTWIGKYPSNNPKLKMKTFVSNMVS